MTILQMSLGGGVIIAVILFLRRVLLYRLPKWAFLLLWAAALGRLLIPITVPSPYSVYTGAALAVQTAQEAQKKAPNTENPVFPVFVPDIFHENNDGTDAPEQPENAEKTEKTQISLINAVYLTGVVLCALVIFVSYRRGLRRFRGAVPAEQDFIARWIAGHPVLFPVKIKICGAIAAPLAYGLFRPVILLPETIDWDDTERLTCILTHEYVHIRRGDLGWKRLMAAALCLHWFNPLVWVMYVCANRDLELACDEAAIRILGLDRRKNYALTLLSAAEEKGFPLFSTYKSKSHIEERIRAIMKIEKGTLAATLTALLLVAGVTTAFATSSASNSGKNAVTLPPDEQTRQTQTANASSHHADEHHDNGGLTVDSVGFVSGMGCGDPYCTDASHHHDCPPDCTDYDHYHNCALDCADSQHHHSTTGTGTGTGTGTHHAETHHNNNSNSSGNASVIPAAVPAVQKAVVPAAQAAQASEPALVSDQKTWDIPAGPIPKGTVIPVADRDEARALIDYLAQERGIAADDASVSTYENGKASVLIHYTASERKEKIRERLPDGTFPVNDKGETYGMIGDSAVTGYEADLIAAEASNGAAGYITYDQHGGYTGKIETPEDALAYTEWQKTRPSVYQIPVYDVNHENIVGYMDGINHNGYDQSPEEIEKELKTMANQLRELGRSEDEIAKELAKMRESKS